MSVPAQEMIEAGRLLSIETGSYSDYSVIGFFVVLVDFAPLLELEKFRPKESSFPWPDKFVHYLISKGFLLEVDRSILHLETGATSFRKVVAA